MKRLALIIAIIIAIIAPLSPATACDGPNCDVITGGANGNVDTSQWMNLDKEALADGWKFMADGGQRIMGQGHAGSGLTVSGKGKLNQAHWVNAQAATPIAEAWQMSAADMTLKAEAGTGPGCDEIKIAAATNRSTGTVLRSGEAPDGKISMAGKTEHGADASYNVKGVNPSVAVDIKSQTGYVHESFRPDFQAFQTGTSEITIKGGR
ncbi:MAG: hypothetical protein V1867_08410 [Candidatus Falkowbacteria bacterium]